jgi:hypothetical protein
VAEDAKTVRGTRWARVAEIEMELDGKDDRQIPRHNENSKTYVDIEK